MYNGVINVYKEKDFTSFDVVAKLRGILKQKKIGHTGTLDPDAEGVLVVCLGKATKLCEVLTDKDKSYEATLLLGKTSDTEDASGKILSEQEVNLSEAKVREAILSFIGTYEQIPPMYSAIKVNGKKLYELARQGIEVERTPRTVQIHSIDIISMDLPYVTFKVSCGKGTYIRSLCRDIGEKLGCGGLMSQLVRNSVNAAETGKVFTKEEALTLDRIEELVNTNQINDYILPIDSMFPKLSKVCVTRDGEKKLLNGNILFKEEFSKDEDGFSSVVTEGKFESRILVYDANKQFTAIYQYNDELQGFKAEKMFL